MRKTVFRFFTIADYEDEERWLREQHQSGWKMVSMTPPGFFTFESCQPQDVIYRLDYKNTEQTEEYTQLARDFGWECFDQYLGWLYFRKPAEAEGTAETDELFSDNASRVEMAGHIVRTRLLPLTLIFFCCLLPGLVNAIEGRMSAFRGFFGLFFGIMFVLYVYIIVHSGIKLKMIRDRYRR